MIERLWAVMHQKVTYNRYYPTQKQFANAILRFFRETIPSEWKVFRDQVSDNFRVITHEKVRVLGWERYSPLDLHLNPPVTSPLSRGPSRPLQWGLYSFLPLLALGG
jgi:hypothetical protein